MSKVIKTPQNPYFDDFDSLKNYVRILYVPEKAVQARELNQSQTIIQDQLSKLSDHIFKNGSKVTEANTNINLEYAFATITLNTTFDTIHPYINGVGKIVGASGVEAKMISGVDAVDSDDITLYLQYTTSGTNNTDLTFVDGETFDINDSDDNVVATGNIITTGNGSIIHVSDGVFYSHGAMIEVSEQSLILDKYSNTPTYLVGFDVTAEYITESEDTSLNDNAFGAPNENAPGAHRLKMVLTLVKKDVNSTNDKDKFIEISLIDNGIIKEELRNHAYSELETTLSQRTYEESGNYSVNPFSIDVREHLNDNDNNGIYLPGDGGVDDKLAVGVGSGLAYVNGHRVENISTKYIDVDKARDIDYSNNSVTNLPLGNYIVVTDLYNIPTIMNFDDVELFDAAIVSNGNASGSRVGYARVRTIEKMETNKYKFYLFDVRMDSGKVFSVDVLSLYQAGSPAFTANAEQISSETIIYSPQSNNMIFKLPYNNIKSIRTENNDVDTSYTVKKEITSTVDAFGNIDISSGANETFVAFSDSDYILSITSGGDVGDVVDLTGKVALSGTPIGSILNISGLSAYASETVKLIVTYVKQLSQEKSKSLSVHTITGETPATEISLEKSDIYSVSILTETSGTDVTDYFDVDNGQRDNYYDVGKITLKSAYTLPTENLDITVNHFVHGAGDYFSVNSYDGVVDYLDISDYTATNGNTYKLIDCIDFRPTKDNTGSDFSGIGSDTGQIFKPGSYFRSDFSYYLDRMDVVYISDQGEFKIKSGVSSLFPQAPTIPADSMELYRLYIPAYTDNLDAISIDVIENRRYTMNDIGKLDKRIGNLEYYTSLNLLEKDTANLQITDSSGFDKFKNGFVVDNFSGHSVGDVFSQEYDCSIDIDNNLLRSPFYANSIKVNVESMSAHDNMDIITVPYTEELLFEQQFASDYMNLNPYMIFRWDGIIKLTPESDNWISETRAPAVIINENGEADDLVTINDRRRVIWNRRRNTRWRFFWGTRWGFWGRNWTGRRNRFARNNRTRNTRTNDVDSTALRNLGSRTTSSTRTIGNFRVTTNTTTTNKVVDDRVIDRSAIPWMRSIEVEFDVKRLRPNTKLFPFFDDIDVSDFVKPIDGDYGNALISDQNGMLSGVFIIPDGNDTIKKNGLSTDKNIRFQTGEKSFRLIDDNTNDEARATCIADATFNSAGVLVTKQRTILSTRSVTTSRVRIPQPAVPARIDPLAQSFFIDSEGGRFITKIDVYFATKDDVEPVVLQLREMENGMPTLNVIPFGQSILYPDEVNVSDDSSVSTTFTFDNPVYLNQDVEYCFVLMADTIGYNAFLSKMGQFDLISDNLISKQPFLGSLFKSQNNSTWTPEQTMDLKFKIHGAVFDTSSSFDVNFENEDLDVSLIEPNGIESENTSSTVKVFCQDHGFVTGDTAVITGAIGGNGIADTDINDSHVVTYASADTFKFDAGVNANNSGRFGGEDIFISKNLKYDLATVNVQQLELQDTSIDWDLKTISGQSYGGSEIAYVDSGYQPVIENEDVAFNSPRLIASNSNNSGNKSMHVKATLKTDNPNVSPVIDKDRTSVIVISNRINNPDVSDDDYSDEVLTTGSALSKYVSRKVVLNDNADSLRVYMDVNRPQNTDIDVYYKISKSEDDTAFDEVDYVLMNATSEPVQNDAGEFNEAIYDVDGLDEFNIFTIKIVMRSDNSAKVPEIMNFRAIASV